MKIQTLPVGLLETNCYLLTDEASEESAVIDPGFADASLEQAVLATGRVSIILLTHGHFDHISGVEKIRQQTGAKVYLLEQDADLMANPELNLSAMFCSTPLPPVKADVLLQDGGKILLGKSVLEVIATPGHTHGSCCYKANGALFSGDTLMRGSIGRTDFPTGSMAAMERSLEKLKALEDDLVIYPGHGPATFLNVEKRRNPYLNKEIGHGFTN